MPTNPKPYLRDLVGKRVIVRLKWGATEYRGQLVSSDSYMNLELKDAVEYIDDESKAPLGEVLIRCNNVMWIAPESVTLGDQMEESNAAEDSK